MSDNSARKADVVLEGGGVKGIGLVGVLSELGSAGYRFQRVAGTSAGAVVGSLLAAGMSYRRMEKVMHDLDYRRFRDRRAVEMIPFVGKGVSLALESGLYQGNYLREWLGNQLADLGVHTFADLALDDPEDSLTADQRFRLVVTATDVTAGQLLRLPWDYRRVFDRDPGQQLVVDAVRASMSIPFFFKPVEVDNVVTGRRTVLVDGGLLSNFPIDMFDRSDGRPPRWPTFGVKLTPALPAEDAEIFPLLGLPQPPPLHLLESLVATTIVGHDQTYLAQPWVSARSIRVDTNKVNFVDFGLSDAQKDLLFENGRKAGAAFLSTWNWEDYLTRFRMQRSAGRAATPPTTRARVGATR